MADTAAETVDARTVKYLLRAALKKEEEEEEERRRKEWEEENRSARETLERAQRIIDDAASLPPLEGKSRKRKKR